MLLIIYKIQANLLGVIQLLGYFVKEEESKGGEGEEKVIFKVL